MDKFKFGDKLLYTSPQGRNLRTMCIFVRDDNGKAVVFFAHAEWAARVNYCQLEYADPLHQSERNLEQSSPEMACLMDSSKKVTYPCSRVCPLFGDCVTKWRHLKKEGS